jgi:plastocyanin
MKHIHLLLFALFGFAATNANATSYTIDISGLSYTPATLNVVVGDEIMIQASGTHPLAEVSEATWNANGNTAMPSGFGVHTSSYTFTVTTVGTIYYVCQNHVGAGMKGLINVSVATGIIDAAEGAELQVYPNIVMNGIFHVSAESDVLKGATVELYSTNGELVKSYAMEAPSAEFRAKVATGTYMAVIRKDKEVLLRQRMVFITD